MMNFSILLTTAGVFSAIASILHLTIIVRGPDWYRLFGAGEHMAQLAEKKSIKPALITVAIAVVLAVWACYAWSGAGLLPELPLLKTGLIVITSIYLLRGLLGLAAPLFPNHPVVQENSKTFWFLSSVVCCLIGFVHLLGLASVWGRL